MEASTRTTLADGDRVPRLFKTMWGAIGAGSPYPTMAEALPAIAAEGWAGVVYAPVAEQFDPDAGTLEELADRCASFGLELVVMVHTWGRTLDDHRRGLDAAVARAVAVRPRHLVGQVGLDAFGPDERSTFFRHALDVEAACGVTIAHETHRMRPLFTPWATRDVLAEFPELSLALDLSHWVVVAERLLDDIDDLVETCASRALHLDARIGYEESPQVPDPDDPRWAQHVAWFDRQWQRVAAGAASVGRQLVVVPEFGPPPYLQTVPRTGEPVVDLWATCRAQRDRLAAMFTAGL